MISLNKFLVAIFLVAGVFGIKAEDAKQTSEEQQSKLDQYINKAKEGARKVKNTIIAIDPQEKISIMDTHAQGFFRTYPTEVLAATWFLAGKAVTHYNTANNASRHFAIEKDLSTATIDKDILHRIEKSAQHCKNSFVRSCNKLGKRNMIISLLLAGGHIYYNHIKKTADVDNKQPSTEILEKNKEDLSLQPIK